MISADEAALQYAGRKRTLPALVAEVIRTRHDMCDSQGQIY